jgi:hypothetical protein
MKLTQTFSFEIHALEGDLHNFIRHFAWKLKLPLVRRHAGPQLNICDRFNLARAESIECVRCENVHESLLELILRCELLNKPCHARTDKKLAIKTYCLLFCTRKKSQSTASAIPVLQPNARTYDTKQSSRIQREDTKEKKLTLRQR